MACIIDRMAPARMSTWTSPLVCPLPTMRIGCIPPHSATRLGWQRAERIPNMLGDRARGQGRGQMTGPGEEHHMRYEGQIAETVMMRGHEGDLIDANLARPLGAVRSAGVVVIHHMP